MGTDTEREHQGNGSTNFEFGDNKRRVAQYNSTERDDYH